MGIESYNPSASLNTTLGGKSVAEGMARGDVSDSIRQLMADIAQGIVPTVNVKTYGAVGDGVTNDRAAFVAAVSAARGKRLLIPKGNYLINSDGGSIVLEEVALVGEGPLDGANASIDQGTNLYITGTTNSPFKVRRGGSMEGMGVYYPNQADSASPTAYPAFMDFDFTSGAVQFVHIRGNVIYNAYKFIDINDATGNVGHVDIRDNYICALNRGIYVRHNTEHLRVRGNNFTFGHWLAATEAGARSYMRANATAVQADQSDGVEFVDNLIYGHLNGVLTSAVGLTQFMNISLNKFDSVRYCVKATGAGNFGGVIGGNHFNAINNQANTLQARSLEFSATGTGRETITISGNNFQQSTEDHIFTSSNNPSRDIVVTGNNFLSWAAFKAAGTYGAVSASGTQTNVLATNNYFMGGNNATYSYGIMGSLNILLANANFFESCQRPLSITVGYLAGSGNQSAATGHTASDVYTATTKAWGPNAFDKPQDKTTETITLALVPNYINDAAAATGGVPIGGRYRNGSILMVRAA